MFIKVACLPLWGKAPVYRLVNMELVSQITKVGNKYRLHLIEAGAYHCISTEEFKRIRDFLVVCNWHMDDL